MRLGLFVRQALSPMFCVFVACCGLFACHANAINTLPTHLRPRSAQIEPPHAQDEAQARALWENVVKLRRRFETKMADAARETLWRRYPNTQAAAFAFETEAIEAQRQGNNLRATQLYEQLLYHRPNFVRAARARETYAGLLVRVGRVHDALAMVRALSKDPTALKERDRWVQAVLQPLVETGHTQDALELAVPMLVGAAETDSLARTLYDWTVATATQLSNVTELETLYNAHAHDAAWRFIAPMMGLKIAKMYAHTKDLSRAEAMLKSVTSHFADAPLAQEAKAMLEGLASRAHVEADTVGLLLPLSGRFKQFGERALVAAQLAFKKTPQIKVIVKDTEGDATIAEQALEQMVNEHHIVAAMGPMFSAEATAASVKAEELGVPLLTLSYKEGLPKVGAFVFRTALTVQAQAQSLAKVAFEQLGMQRFAILYPKSPYGIDFAMAFWDEVEKRHGDIRGVESYAPEQTTFREPVRRLVGRWYLNARPEFKEALDKLKERELSGLKMRVEVERLDKKSAPIIDFEGLVIPDAGRQIGLIAPALAFEDVMLTHNPRAIDKMRRALGRDDLKPITLLGGSTWNSPQTAEACDAYCEGAVFVDAFFANSSRTRVRDFVSDFHRETGTQTSLSEAQAFDTATLMARLLSRTSFQNRADFRDALLNMPPFVGVCGTMSFDKNGEAIKELVNLTLHNRVIREWSARN